MRRSAISWSLGAALLCCGLPGSVVLADADEARPSSTETLRLGLRGVYFVPNQGQWSDPGVQYGLRSRGLDVAFRESSFTMHLRREKSGVVETDSGPSDTADDYDVLTLGVTFPGSNPVLPRGVQPHSARFNYHLGGDELKRAVDVPSFASVIYDDLYPGIDLVVAGSDDGVLKYEFHCSAGADFRQIRISYDGVESLCIDNTGDLHIATAVGTLADAAPLVWQVTEGERRELGAQFKVLDSGTYTIELLESPDPMLPFIIDPDVQWMSYLGGSGDDQAHGVAVDSTGAALVTGNTVSSDFEGANNARYGSADAFVLKISATGELAWMTYLGGRSSETGNAIAVDDTGAALITGNTQSDDFAGRSNTRFGGVDAFAVKVDDSGQLIWMTYLGGTSTEDGTGIAVDSQGAALVTGQTLSNDFEGANNTPYGNNDTFVVKIGASGELEWMTYLGGEGHDDAKGITVTAEDEPIVAGITGSAEFAGRINSNHGGIDTFVARVSGAGELQWMTYVGGSGRDEGYGVASDGDGAAFVVGETSSTDMEGKNNSHHGGVRDVFIGKVSASGQIDWVTYLGGNASEYGFGIAVDDAGAAFATGYSYSPGFIGRRNSLHGGLIDAFVVKVRATGDLEWMLFLGGSGGEEGLAISVDSLGHPFVAGLIDSEDFGGRNNNFHGGSTDAYVAKVQPPYPAPQLVADGTCPGGGPILIEWSGATPHGQVALIFARATGAYVIRNGQPCAGTQLGLGMDQIQLAFRGSAGPNGSRVLSTTTGPGACGGRLQLLDLATCAPSNVVRIE